MQQHAAPARQGGLQTIRNCAGRQGFVEVETPILTKSTPEGARDFLVPSRLHPGPSTPCRSRPQIYKQLLMLAGYDRYYPDRPLLPRRGQPRRPPAGVHPVRHRDELCRRGGRHGRGRGRVCSASSATVKGVELQLPLPRMTWQDAMDTLRLGQARHALRPEARRT